MGPKRLRGLSALVAREPPLPSGERLPRTALGSRALTARHVARRARAGPRGAQTPAAPPAAGRRRALVPAPSAVPARVARAGRHFSALDDRGANGQDLAGDGGGAAEGDSSSSGSNSVIEHLGRGRVRMRHLRARRAQRRAKLCADAILAAQEAGVSLLETLAVTRPTQVRYQRYFDLFYSRVGLKRGDILAKADTEIDELFCNYLTENYLQGEQRSYGDQTMAAGGLDAVFRRLGSAASKEPLWNFDCPEASALLREAAEDLGIAPVTLHQMRHSGASVDLANGWRNLTSTQRRGEWAQAKSVHRYEHSSMLGSSYAKLAPALRAVREQAERQLTQILTGQPLSVRPGQN
ncbi:unnamed protein product [Prorocentrum cordatum]|uniref:Tyr recombinase domain-containing protein n=1 Tax=Prorocentrum cordatum TaxID=2364126 RepID=A0ABN9T1J9_9DINO|nr:unnamed protein product [Polarella glacialis]